MAILSIVVGLLVVVTGFQAYIHHLDGRLFRGIHERLTRLESHPDENRNTTDLIMTEINSLRHDFQADRLSRKGK